MPTTAASFTAAWRKSTSSTSRGDRRPGAPSGQRGRAPRPRAAARRSRDQEHLARRLPPFQGPVGLGGVLEGELELGPQPELAVANRAEHLARAPELAR